MKSWEEIIREANEIEAKRKANEKPECKDNRDPHGLRYNCDCSKCWHDEFDNCICGNCTTHN